MYGRSHRHSGREMMVLFESFEDVAGRHACVDAMDNPSRMNRHECVFGLRLLPQATEDEVATFLTELGTCLPRYVRVSLAGTGRDRQATIAYSVPEA